VKACEKLDVLRTFFINMDAATERRAFMEAQLARLGISAERWPAVTDPTFTAEPSFKLRGRGPMTNGELGCFESHTQLWAECMSSNQALLILEDDAFLSERLPELLKTIDGGMPEDADILRLETTNGRGRFGQTRSLGGIAFYRVMQPQFCSAAYIITPRAADWLLADTAGMLCNVPVDLYLFDRPAIYDLRIWQAAPGLAVQPEFSPEARAALASKSAIYSERRDAHISSTPQAGIGERVAHYAKLLRRFSPQDLAAYRFVRDVRFA
jgi:glycosyl transferase family 25